MPERPCNFHSLGEVQLTVFIEVHERVADFPCVMIEEEAFSVMTGTGAGITATVTLEDVFWPEAVEHVIVYVVVTAGYTASTPVNNLDPDHPPDAKQVRLFSEVHTS